MRRRPRQVSQLYELTPTMGQNQLRSIPAKRERVLPWARGGAQAAAWAVGDGWEWGAAPRGWGQPWRRWMALTASRFGDLTQHPVKKHRLVSACL